MAPKRSYLKTLCLAGVLATAIPSLNAQESNTFLMNRVTVVAGAARVSSSSFETTLVAAQHTPAGVASFCNRGFLMSLGFWSVLGDLPVPMRLGVRLNETDPITLDLSWTGTDDVFQVFRAFTPVDILNPANFYQETVVCEATDTTSTGADIIYYKVIPRP